MKYMVLPVGPGSDIWVDWGDGSDKEHFVVADTSQNYPFNLFQNLSSAISDYDSNGTTLTDQEFLELLYTVESGVTLPYHVYDDAYTGTEADIRIWGTVSYWYSLPINLKAMIGPNDSTPYAELSSVVKDISQWGDLVTTDFGTVKSDVNDPIGSSIFTMIPSGMTISATDYPKYTNLVSLSGFISVVPSVGPDLELYEFGLGDTNYSQFNVDFSSWSNLDFSSVTEYDGLIYNYGVYPVQYANYITPTLDLSSWDMTHITITSDVEYPETMFDSDVVPVTFIPPTFTVTQSVYDPTDDYGQPMIITATPITKPNYEYI